jgi:hypothetical protein
MAWTAGDSSRAVLRFSCAWICSGLKMKGSPLCVNSYERMSAQREVFNEDPNNSNHTKTCVDFREKLAWSPLLNSRDPQLVW